MTMNPFFEDIVIEMSGQGPTGKTGNSIESIVKTSTEVLTDTYTITFTWGNTSTFEVENGNGIVSITKTGTDVLTDTYTVLFSNETTTTFDVVNGRGISSIAKKSTDVLQDVYEITYNDGTTSDYTVTNGRGITSIEKSGSHDNVDIYKISYNDNTVSTFQVVNGIDGTAATIAVGSTMTGLPGTDASVTNSGTSRDAVFNFVIPRGNTGNGIASIALVGTVGLTKTYRVTYTDGEHFDYQVLDGNGIASIVLYSTSGLNKTYRVTYTNGDHFDYVVSDGNGISSITLLSQSGLVKTYRITYTNGTHFDFSVSDGNGIASIEKTATVGAVDTYTVTFTDPTAEPFSYDVTNGSDEWGAIVGDIAAQTDLQNALDNKAPAIVESAQGDIVTIADGADLPVESLSVSVEPVQDLHGYDNPWPAGGGKNLFDPNSTNDAWVNTNGTISTRESAKSMVIPTTNGETWTLSNANISSSSNILLLAFFDSSNNMLRRYPQATGTKYLTATAPADSAYLIASFFTWSEASQAQLEKSSTATSYAPYSNICPISGWSEANVTRTRVNLFNASALTSDAYITVNSDESITATANDTRAWTNLRAIPLPAGTFTIRANGLTSGALVFRTSENNYSSDKGAYQGGNYSQTFTLTKAGGIKFKIGVNASYPQTTKIMLVQGNYLGEWFYISGEIWTPSNGTSVTIPLGQTVYGGTLDVEAGEMAITGALKTFDGTENWKLSTAWEKTNTAVFYNDADSTIKYLSYDYESATSCDTVPPHTRNWIYANDGNGIGCSGPVGSPSPTIRISKTIATTVDEFKAWLNNNNLHVVYELATPTVITGLTPAILRTLLGYNAIWADCGAVDVSYRADTKLFVEKSIESAVTAVKRIMTTTTDTMVAPKNLTSGEIVIVGDDLYKATANIASGATLTVGSNVVKVTLAEWVASLVA